MGTCSGWTFMPSRTRWMPLTISQRNPVASTGDELQETHPLAVLPPVALPGNRAWNRAETDSSPEGSFTEDICSMSA
jgi:hypothetical protein